MKTKSTIKLFATAILATAAIGVADVVNTTSNVFASEVTQIPNKNSVGTRTTFETDPVFNNFEEGEKYLESYVKPTIENSRYGAYDASVVPDGLGGKYVVMGVIDSLTDEEAVIKGNKETAQKIVDNAGKDASAVKPVTPVKPVDEGKVSNNIKEITGEFKFTDIKTTSTGLTFKAKLPEVAPHDGPVLPNIQATLTDKATGKEVAKTGVVLEDLSEEFKKSDALLYANLLEGSIFNPSLTSGNYILTVEGTTGPNYGQNTDKRKRHFVFSTEVTLRGQGNATTTTQPAEEVKPVTPTKPSEEVKPVTPTKPSEDVKPVTPTKPTEEDKPVTPTKPTEEVKPATPTKPAEEVKPVTPTKPTEEVKPVTPTKPSEDIKPETPVKPVTPNKSEKDVKSETPAKTENNKNNDKKTLPNTGESTSTLGIIGTILSIAGLGFIVKRKRG